jgi:hypothetical protein
MASYWVFGNGKDIFDVLKILGDVALPVVGALLAFFINKRSKSFESVMKQRVAKYVALSPLLNDIYTYRMELGDYLSRKPEDILAAKREADRQLWTFEYLFSKRFRDAYHGFMVASFKMFNAKGTRALIRVKKAPYRQPSTTEGWPGYSDEEVPAEEYRGMYQRLQEEIARDLTGTKWRAG